MSFMPRSGQELFIEGLAYHVSEHPSSPGIPYGQEGRRAVVYQLVDQSGNKHALKVFKQRFRVPRLTTVAEKLKPCAELPGLQASERIVLTSSQHRRVLKKYPDLTYAVLMPWVEGPTWVEVLLSDVSLTRDQSLQIANSFIETLVAMEERGLAHCDLSGPNTIITAGNQVALVDLEEMYGPEFLKPRVVPAGSPGYAHKSAPEGLWREESDRFAGAVLVAEMLGWVNDRVRANARGESYFDAGELQKGNGRFDVLVRALGETWGEGVTKLMERVWQSDRLVDCPTFAEWSLVLPERKEGDGISPILDSIEVGRVGFVEEDIASDLSDVWYCSYCEQPVAVKLGVCPHCELGSRPEHLVPSAEKEIWRCPHCQKTLTGEVEVCPYCKKGIDEPVEVLITKQKKKIPLWGWVGIGIVIVGIGLTGLAIKSGKNGLISSQVSKTPTLTNPHAPTEIILSTSTSLLEPILTHTINPSPTPTILGGGSGKIAFSSNRDGNQEIYVMDVDGTNLLRLTNNNVPDWYPSWSPDGLKIVFYSNREWGHDIYVMDANGGNVQRLTTNEKIDFAPTWSPDGAKIAFVSWRDGNREIYTIDSDGRNVQRLTNSEAIDLRPSWSPNGSRIVFYSDRDGDYDIYVMDEDGGNVESLTNNGVNDIYPAWSFDGSKIAFVSNRDGNYEIYVMDIDTSNSTRLTYNDVEDSYPSWSPDGMKIAFYSDRDGNWDIYVMDADGSNEQRLTNHGEYDCEPAWAP